MTAQASRPLPDSHPAPHQHRVRLVALLFGMFAAPMAWDLQLLLSAALSGHACYPRDVPLTIPSWPHWGSTLFGISLAAIVINIVAGLVAVRSWSRTNREKPGSGHHLLDAGEGRTRFLAMFGILTSALFLVATLFATAVQFFVPLCA